MPLVRALGDSDFYSDGDTTSVASKVAMFTGQVYEMPGSEVERLAGLVELIQSAPPADGVEGEEQEGSPEPRPSTSARRKRAAR